MAISGIGELTKRLDGWRASNLLLLNLTFNLFKITALQSSPETKAMNLKDQNFWDTLFHFSSLGAHEQVEELLEDSSVKKAIADNPKLILDAVAKNFCAALMKRILREEAIRAEIERDKARGNALVSASLMQWMTPSFGDRNKEYAEVVAELATLEPYKKYIETSSLLVVAIENDDVDSIKTLFEEEVFSNRHKRAALLLSVKGSFHLCMCYLLSQMDITEEFSWSEVSEILLNICVERKKEEMPGQLDSLCHFLSFPSVQNQISIDKDVTFAQTLYSCLRPGGAYFLEVLLSFDTILKYLEMEYLGFFHDSIAIGDLDILLVLFSHKCFMDKVKESYKVPSDIVDPIEVIRYALRNAQNCFSTLFKKMDAYRNNVEHELISVEPLIFSNGHRKSDDSEEDNSLVHSMRNCRISSV